MTLVLTPSPDGDLPAPPPGLEFVWERVCNLLAHQRLQLAAEDNIQTQQRGMIRDGCFLMPSPFPGRAEDECQRSWVHEYQFFYQFDPGEAESYYWVTGQLDRAYALDTIWFPERNVAITNYLPSVGPGLLDRFIRMLELVSPKPIWRVPPVAIPRVLVTGFQHLMHMMWNQLPALDRLAGSALPGDFSIAVLCEPFGPTASLFPELGRVIRTVRNEDLFQENARNGLVLGLGSWTITSSSQQRVRDVCAKLTSTATIERRDDFAAKHDPIFWISVKPPKRTMSDQPETIAALIVALHSNYSRAGFIIDGASLPWDYAQNSNYPPWFQAFATNAVSNSATIIDSVVAQIPSTIARHVVTLNGISACDEVAWGEIATFYICHGGTMQNKIGWIHQTPGFIHSNHSFITHYQLMPPPVVPAPTCFYVPQDIVVDDDTHNYSEMELARKDQNYSFTSTQLFIESVLNSAASVVPVDRRSAVKE